MRYPCLMLLVMAGLAQSADDTSEADIRKKLSGVWVGHVVEGKGDKPGQERIKLQITITPERISAIQDDKLDLGEGSYKLDLSTKPWSIDATRTKGNGPKGSYKGLIALDGDTLRWVSGTPNKDRPSELVTVKGQFLSVLQRKK